MTGLMDKLKAELFEEDPVAAATAATKATQAATPAPATLTVQPAAPVFTSPAFTAPLTFGAATTVDPDALKLIRDSVLVDTVNGHPSAYMKFVKIWEAMKRPSDISTVINVLQVTDASVTVEAIASDLTAHLALLDSTVHDAETEIGNAAQSALQDLQGKMTDLQKQNESAAAEIARHQSEITDRNTQISTLQTQQSEMNAKFEAAKQRTSGAQNAVRAELDLLAATFNVKG